MNVVGGDGFMCSWRDGAIPKLLFLLHIEDFARDGLWITS